jgi:peptidoglycan/xylan/chitin deacetylase (PgdA/CDA1 family)
MLLEAMSGAVLVGAGALAYGVRGRSSTLLGPSIWRGPKNRRAIALTFDDGPSESTRELLDILAEHQAKATFFHLGYHVKRLPAVARLVVEGGHEIGNHSESHPHLYLRPPKFIRMEVARAQKTIEDTLGVSPRWFRAPFGARWFGLKEALEEHELTGVMWTSIARDWALDGQAVADRIQGAARPGAILCLHDGRELRRKPDIGSTLFAMQRLLPEWKAAGFEFLTLSELLCQKA